MEATTRRFGPLCLVSLTCCLALIALWLEGARRAQHSFERGEEAERRGEVIVALDRYQQASRAYAPGIDAPWLALQKLERLAEEGERRGGPEGQALAIGALSRLRGARWATRGLLDPYAERFEAWDQRLATLLAQQDEAEATRIGEVSPSLGELEALHLAILTRDPLPPLLWSLCLGLGLLLSGVGALGVIWRGLDGKLNARPELVRWLLTLTLGAVLWVTALACMPA